MLRICCVFPSVCAAKLRIILSHTSASSRALWQQSDFSLQILALPPDMAKGGKGPLLICDQLDLELMWKRLLAVKELSATMRETIRVTVTGCVDKGLLINMFGVRGFVPVSHVIKESDQQWLAKDDLQVRSQSPVCCNQFLLIISQIEGLL